MVVFFNLQNSHLLTLSLTTEEVFQVNGQNRLVANFPVVDFHPQPKEILTPKLSVLLLAYWFSSPSRKVGTSLSVSDTDFLVFNSIRACVSNVHLIHKQNLAIIRWHVRHTCRITNLEMYLTVSCYWNFFWLRIFSLKLLLIFIPQTNSMFHLIWLVIKN